jgi:Ca2+-binding EF-hand superfamily protein
MNDISRRASITVIFLVSSLGWAGTADQNTSQGKGDPQKLPPAFLELIKGSADDFIRRFDKNHDGFLSKDELPPRLAQLFDKADANADGKLDRSEVEDLLYMLRQHFGLKHDSAAKNPEVDAMLARVLEQMDTNKDGKISRDEARGPFKQNFDRIDVNQDGFLDKDELKQAIARMLALRKNAGGQQAGAPKVQIPDFDALDKNADGRLTRDELAGTPYADKFDEMDTNKDGKIDPKEFASYFRKQFEKQNEQEKK